MKLLPFLSIALLLLSSCYVGPRCDDCGQHPSRPMPRSYGSFTLQVNELKPLAFKVARSNLILEQARSAQCYVEVLEVEGMNSAAELEVHLRILLSEEESEARRLSKRLSANDTLCSPSAPGYEAYITYTQQSLVYFESHREAMRPSSIAPETLRIVQGQRSGSLGELDHSVGEIAFQGQITGMKLRPPPGWLEPSGGEALSKLFDDEDKLILDFDLSMPYSVR